MTTASLYAKALHAALEEGKVNASGALKNLKEALARRGHQKLLPHIFNAYTRLEEQRTRSAMYKEVTPERERTRVLYELYRKLING